MAKSKAKKLREKLTREGKRNPEASRSIYADMDSYKKMISKTTKTKKDILSSKNKRQSSYQLNEDGCLYYFSMN